MRFIQSGVTTPGISASCYELHEVPREHRKSQPVGKYEKGHNRQVDMSPSDRDMHAIKPLPLVQWSTAA